jgi:hypothetical protein
MVAEDRRFMLVSHRTLRRCACTASVLGLTALLTGCGERDAAATASSSPAPPTVTAVAVPHVDPLAGHVLLDWPAVADAVIAGNPSIAASRAMLDAALAYHRLTGTGSSQAGVYAARAHRAESERAQLLAARDHFANYWLTQRTLAIDQAARALISSLVDTTTAAASNGGDVRAVIDAQVMLDELDRDVLAAEREQHVHALALNTLLGRACGDPVPPARDPLPDDAPLPSPSAISVWANEAPMVQIARAHRLEAEANLTLAERSFYPQDMGMVPGEEMSGFPPREIPPENRAAVIAQWRALAAERSEEQRAAELSSQREVLAAWVHIDECASTLTLLGHQGKALHRMADLARSGFASGSTPLSNVVLAQRALLALEQREASTQRDAFVWRGWLIITPNVQRGP